LREQKTHLSKIVIEPSKGWFGLNLKDIWFYRELFIILAQREIQLRYRQTALGVIWVILQPLMTTAIFTIIFGRLMNVNSENVSYELFAFAGLLPWGVFSQSLQRAGVSLTRDIRLITKVFFPRIIIPVASAISTLVDFCVSFAILVVLLLIYQISFTTNLLIIPLLLVVTLVLSIGVGIVFAALNVYYRDFAYVLPFVVQIWLYASPLAYSSNIIPSSWTWVYDLNPMVGIIDSFRWALLGSENFPVDSLLYSIIVSSFCFVFGLMVFRRLERKFADVI